MAETQTPGTEVAVFRSGDLSSLDTLGGILTSGQQIEWDDTEDDGAEIARQIVAQILAADSNDEVLSLSDSEATGWGDLLGVPVELEGFSARPSTFEGEGPGIFMVVYGTRLDEGERVVLTTGSLNIMAQLVNMAKRGELTGSIVAAKRSEKQTRRGFYPLWLVAAEAKDK